MDQRGIGWAGAILIFIVGSIVLTLAINPQFREDIVDWFRGLGGSGGPSISELVNNPAQYNGQKVTVEGDLMFGGGVEGALWTIWEGDDCIGIIMDLNTSQELGWGETGRVKVTGTFQAPNKILATKLEKA